MKGYSSPGLTEGVMEAGLGLISSNHSCGDPTGTLLFREPSADLHFPRKPIGEQAPADEISPPHLRGRKLSQPGSVR